MRTIFLTAVLVAVVFGRNPSSDGSVRNLNRSYENLAHEALSRYFDDGTFLVRAQVELLDVEGNSLEQSLPHRASQTPIGSLPGLPYYAKGEENESAPEGRIASVQIEVLVDTTYTARDRGFIEYLVTLGADLDTSRGDEVLVQRTFFPRDNRAMGPHRKADPSWSDAHGKPPAVSDSDSGRSARIVAPPAPKDLTAELLERIMALLPLLVVCFTALACAWLLGRAILSSKGESEEKLMSRLNKWRRRRQDTDQPRPSLVLPGPRTAAPPPYSAEIPKTPSAEIRNYRPELLESFVGNPRLAGQVIKHWMVRDSQKGARQAGILLAGLDPNLLDMVRDSLGEEASRQVQAIAQGEDRGAPEEFVAASQAFLRDYRKWNLRQSEAKEADLFGFLEQLNEAQIAHVLKGESAGVAGFALAQISSDKASSLLSKLDPATRAKLLVGMGNVTQIPREVYKDMADRLSLKAMDVANMKFVASDGIDTILKLIDTLPLDEQFEYIHSISEVDINLARRLRERTITFSELASLPDRFLAPRLQNLDPETLTLALLRADQALRSKILSLLPDRQQQMMVSSMESRKQATRPELDAAARRLLQAVRDEIRRQGRPQ